MKADFIIKLGLFSYIGLGELGILFDNEMLRKDLSLSTS
jgi:hypothetical protein